MKQRGQSWGIFILIVGVLYLLYELGFLGYELINALFVFWPLFIIALGIEIAFSRNYRIVRVTWLIALLVIVFFSIFGTRFDFYNQSRLELDNTEVIVLEDLQPVELPRTKPAKGVIDMTTVYQRLSIAHTHEAEIITAETFDFDVDTDGEKSAYTFDSLVGVNKDNKALTPLLLSESKSWDLNFDAANLVLAVDDAKLHIDHFNTTAVSCDMSYQYRGEVASRVNVEALSANLVFRIVEGAPFAIHCESPSLKLVVDGERIDGASYQTGEMSRERGLNVDVEAVNATVIVETVPKE